MKSTLVPEFKMPRTMIALFLLFGIAIAHEKEIDSALRSVAMHNPHVKVADYHGRGNLRHISITGIIVNGFETLRRDGHFSSSLLPSNNAIFGRIAYELAASATVEVTGGIRPFKKDVIASGKGLIASIGFFESSHGLRFSGIGDVSVESVTIPEEDYDHVLKAFEIIFADATVKAFEQLKSPPARARHHN